MIIENFHIPEKLKECSTIEHHSGNLIYIDNKDPFVGCEFNGIAKGTLTVIGSFGCKRSGSSQLYAIHCSECAKDPELFGDGIFKSTKSNISDLKQCPCGCAKQVCWTTEQYKTKILRVWEDKIVFNFPELIKRHTKIECECKIDGHVWMSPPCTLLSNKSGCDICGNIVIGIKTGNRTRRKDYMQVLLDKLSINNCNFIGWCSKEGYKSNKSYFLYECPRHGMQKSRYDLYAITETAHCPQCAIESTAEKLRNKNADKILLEKLKENDDEFIKWKDGKYKNGTSRFYYTCLIHGITETNYHRYVIVGSRCKKCFTDKGYINGYFYDRLDEDDNLYILNFNNEFIKVGRSFNINKRVKELKYESGMQNILLIDSVQDIHSNIYGLEQWLHGELKDRGFHHYVDWSTECFSCDSIDCIKYLIKEQGYT